MLNVFTTSFGDARTLQGLLGAQLALTAQIDGCSGTLLVSVQRFVAAAPTSPKRRIRKLTLLESERVCAEIKACLTTGVRMTRIAAAIGLSSSQLSRSFHASMGVTFSAYFLRIRIEEAKRLMTETDLPLSEIAIESGFGDQSNFSRSFLRDAGMTPYKWRLLHAGS